MTGGIYLLPVELLLAIFTPLSKQDLAALRLASKFIGDVASQLYLDSITIALRRQTFVDIRAIIRHPELKKGVRRVNFDISQYDDKATEEEVYAQKLKAKLENELEGYLVNACDRHHSKLRRHVFHKHTCKRGVLCNPKRISDLQDWIKLCEGLPTAWENRLWVPRRAASIFKGYARYCELAEDQKRISRSEEHVELLEIALKHMPSVKSLEVVDLSNAISRSSITLDNGNGHNAFCLDRILVDDPKNMAAFRLDNILLAWRNQGLRLEEFICKEAGPFQQMLPAPLVQKLLPGTGSFLREVTLLVNLIDDKEYSFGGHDDEAIEKMVSGSLNLMILKAEALVMLMIEGETARRGCFPLVNIVAPTPRQNLMRLSLKRLRFNFKDLMTFCAPRRKTLVCLSFDKVLIMDGRWRDAVEKFHTELELRMIYFRRISDRFDGRHGFTKAERDMMSLYVVMGGREPFHSFVARQGVEFKPTYPLPRTPF